MGYWRWPDCCLRESREFSLPFFLALFLAGVPRPPTLMAGVFSAAALFSLPDGGVPFSLGVLLSLPGVFFVFTGVTFSFAGVPLSLPGVFFAFLGVFFPFSGVSFPLDEVLEELSSCAFTGESGKSFSFLVFFFCLFLGLVGSFSSSSSTKSSP